MLNIDKMQFYYHVLLLSLFSKNPSDISSGYHKYELRKWPNYHQSFFRYVLECFGFIRPFILRENSYCLRYEDRPSRSPSHLSCRVWGRGRPAGKEEIGRKSTGTTPTVDLLAPATRGAIVPPEKLSSLSAYPRGTAKAISGFFHWWAGSRSVRHSL